MSKDKPSTTTLSKYKKNGWITRTMLVDYGLIPRDQGLFALKNPYLAEAEGLLRTNMLFNWLLGDYGPLDDARVQRLDIEDVFHDVMLQSMFSTPVGVVRKFYVDKELTFWKELTK